jgi:ribosome biogenesis GTPase
MAEKQSKNVGRAVGIYGPRVEIMTSDYSVISASIRGKLKYGEKGHSILAVGDYVEFSPKDSGQATIDRIIERTKVISRPAVEREGLVQVIVSNVDRMLIVTSVANPEFRPGVVDRFLVIAFKAEIHPEIIINKADLANPGNHAPYIDAWRQIGCGVLCTSVITGAHMENFARLLQSGTSVVVGHSGVGKSSLLNKLNPELHLRVGEISAYSSKGKHTTSRVNLIRIFDDGWVADTPGLRDLGLVGIAKKNLHLYFPEFAAFEGKCQFGNCVHVSEPTCAIKQAVQGGDQRIASVRYRSYLNIYKTLDK